MVVIIHESFEPTPRGVRARVSSSEGLSAVELELVGDDGLKHLIGPIDVEFDFDAITSWSTPSVCTTGLFSTTPQHVDFVGQVCAIIDFDGSEPIIEVNVAEGIISFESDSRTPRLTEGDWVQVQVSGLRAYPTGLTSPRE